MNPKARSLRFLSLILCMLFGCVAGHAAFAQTPPPIACFNKHCDTELDIFHADITARLVGCSVRKDEAVLVNGRREDGILWRLYKVVPAKPPTFPRVSFRLRSGYYTALTLTVGECSFGPFPLATTDANGDRNLLLIEGLGTAISGVGGVYGYSPLPGLQIVLRGGTSQEPFIARDETVQSGFGGETYMYYFDAVKHRPLYFNGVRNWMGKGAG